MSLSNSGITGLWIDGKPVRKASLGGKVFYEKHNYNLDLVSDKDIISCYDQDTATLTATLTDYGEPVAGETVRFYVVEDVPAGFSFTGNNFAVSSRSSGLSGSNIVIDWGDGSTTTYTGISSLNHTYNEAGDYFITITGVISLRSSCFEDCSGLTSVVIPEGVTSLGHYCFYGCSGLTSIIIPEGVTSLGDACFWNCSALTSVVIPEGVTSLENYCFSGCSALTSVIIPEGVTNIGTSCFYGCSGLTSVIIPEGVTYLGNACFTSCSSLTSIVIPDSVTSLGNNCFNNSGLTSLICNWTTNPPTYNSTWIANVHSSFKFSIPEGTTQAYLDAGYPSNKIVERSE